MTHVKPTQNQITAFKAAWYATDLLELKGRRTEIALEVALNFEEPTTIIDPTIFETRHPEDRRFLDEDDDLWEAANLNEDGEQLYHCPKYPGLHNRTLAELKETVGPIKEITA